MNGLALALGMAAALAVASQTKRGSFQRVGLDDWPYALLVELVNEKARLDARMTEMFPDSDEEIRQSMAFLERDIERWLDQHEAPDAWLARWESGLLDTEIEGFLRQDLTPAELSALMRRRRMAP